MRKTVNKLLDNKLFYILLSLVISFGLWLFVVNSVNPSRTLRITFDIQYEGVGVLEAYNLRLASNNPTSVNMMVEASATDMGRLEQNPVLIVDVSSIREAGEHDVVFFLADRLMLMGTVTYTPIGSSISNTDNTLIVRANRITGRSVDLAITGIEYGILETGDDDHFYVGDPPIIEPESIWLDGPEDVLERIRTIEVVSHFIDDLSETETQDGILRVYDEAGERIPEADLQDVTFSQFELSEVTVNVTIPVRTVRNVPLGLLFEYGAGANEENVRYRLSQETVRLIGAGEVLNDLPRLGLPIIDLARVGVLDTVRLEIPAPGWTEIYDGSQYVTVEIEIFDVDVLEIVVPRERVFFTGLTEDVEAEAVLDPEIVIRGPAEILEELEGSDLSILVDLSDYIGRTTGRVIVEAFTVQVGDWPSEIVGAMDLSTHRIIVNIQRIS